MADDSTITEIWLNIPFAPGYLVSSIGRVRGRRGGILKPFINRDGYEIHTFCIDGRILKRATHFVVCTAFNGLKPNNKSHCAHWDGNKLNNSPDNLRWVTAKENAADGLRLGKYTFGNDHWTHKNPEKRACGERHGANTKPQAVRKGTAMHNAAFSEDQVREIRSYPTYRGICIDLSEKYGVSQCTISDCRRRKTYREVT